MSEQADTQPGALLVVSPHCDDGVFSCGALIASSPGSVVVTVFAGSPPCYEPFTEWDSASGFVPGDDVMRLRREEDRRALTRLGATPEWLGFLDSQYGASPRAEQIAAALREPLDRYAPAIIAIPLGLFHSDHALVHAAALTLLSRYRQSRWLVYEEALYRRIPGAVSGRMAELEQTGYRLRRFTRPSASHANRSKREAMVCYASQLKALATPGRPGHEDAAAPEVYFELTRLEVDA